MRANTGFSVHNSVTVSAGDPEATERLARYLMRPPLSLERMSLDEQGCVLYQPKPSRRFEPTRTFDPLDFLARLLMHVPEPRRHLVRYFSYYSSVQRARRLAQARDTERGTPELDVHPQTPAERRRARRAWAQLIRRVYEVDPLLCE